MATEEEKEWKLFYSEDKFRSFEKMLLIALLKPDQSNKAFLSSKYADSDIENDPIRKLLVALTGNQKTAFEKVVKDEGIPIPSKLDVFRDPIGSHVTFAKLIEKSTIPDNKLTPYENNKDELETKEFELYKTMAKTCLHSPVMLEEAAFGAGRGLL